MGIWPVRETFIIGCAFGSALLTTGMDASVGRLLRMVATFRSTSTAPLSGSQPSTNWIRTLPLPSLESEVKVSMPEMPDIACSIGLTTRSSTSCGAAPANETEMLTKGRDWAGIRSTFSSVKETAPMITRPNMNIKIVKGRLMAIRVRPMPHSFLVRLAGGILPLRLRLARGLARGAGQHADGVAVVQPAQYYHCLLYTSDAADDLLC